MKLLYQTPKTAAQLPHYQSAKQPQPVAHKQELLKTITYFPASTMFYIAVIRPHCLNAVHRCDLFLPLWHDLCVDCTGES